MTNEDDRIKPLVTGMTGACVMLDCGIDKLYDLIAAKEIDSFLEGTRRKVVIHSIESLIERRLASRRDKLDRSQLVEKRLAARRQARSRRGRVTAAERESAA
jgi:hypothetical protein